jgi:hypothetical protein
MTTAGSSPTIHVLVPSSVMGPGFGARTLRTALMHGILPDPASGLPRPIEP